MDDGERCDAHVGEVFPPRCAACDELRSEPVEVDYGWAPTYPDSDADGYQS